MKPALAVLVIAFVVVVAACQIAFAETADELDKKGEQAYKARKYEKAVEWYTKALELDPHRQTTMYCRGVNLYLLRKFAGALKDLEKVKSTEGLDHKALYYIGLIQTKKKRHNEAFDAFKAAYGIKKDVKYAVGAFESAQEAGKLLDAIFYAQRVLDLDKKNEDAHYFLDHVHHGASTRLQHHETTRRIDEFNAYVKNMQGKYGFPEVIIHKDSGMTTVDTLHQLFKACQANRTPCETALS